MPGSSDLVYDRLIAGDKVRSSDKYEVLAAIVFRILDDAGTTIHDMRLRGATGVRHQIDVVAERGGVTRRTLIECKDYGRKVGLPLVRNFSAAVDDISPDEAFVVTTMGFTKPATQFATAKGIRLALLRPPEDDDWENLVRTINIELRMSGATEPPQISWRVREDVSELQQWPTQQHLNVDDVRVVLSDGSQLTVKDLERSYVQAPAPGEAGIATGSADFADGAHLTIKGYPDLPVMGFDWSQQFSAGVHRFTIGDGVGGLTSDLVLRTLDGDIHRIFSNRGHSIASAGSSLAPKSKVISRRRPTLGLSCAHEQGLPGPHQDVCLAEQRRRAPSRWRCTRLPGCLQNTQDIRPGG